MNERLDQGAAAYIQVWSNERMITQLFKEIMEEGFDVLMYSRRRPNLLFQFKHDFECFCSSVKLSQASMPPPVFPYARSPVERLPTVKVKN